jgi:hypothetical protein
MEELIQNDCLLFLEFFFILIYFLEVLGLFEGLALEVWGEELLTRRLGAFLVQSIEAFQVLSLICSVKLFICRLVWLAVLILIFLPLGSVLFKFPQQLLFSLFVLLLLLVLFFKECFKHVLLLASKVRLSERSNSHNELFEVFKVKSSELTLLWLLNLYLSKQPVEEIVQVFH